MGLRTKLVAVFLVLPVLGILIVSLLEIGHTTRVMVVGLEDSGALLVDQTFEQMRRVLTNAQGDAISALRGDAGLRSLVKSSQAFGRGVAYVRIVDPVGRTILAAPEDPTGMAGTKVYPFEDLRDSLDQWWMLAPLWGLLSRGVYEISRPVDINQRPFAVIKVGLSADLSADEVRRSIWSIFGIGAFAIGLSALAAIVFGRAMLRPLAAITTGVEELAAGQREVNLSVGGRDELGTLAEKFNQLSQRIRTDRRQWETERDQFFNIFRSIADALVLLDSKGHVLFANAEAQGRLGLPAGGIAEGKALPLLIGKDHPLAKMIATAYALGTEVHDVAIELQDTAGTSRFLVSIFSLGHGPEPPGLLVIVRDLEPVRRLENVVDYSGRLARLGALISGVAHQLRNPLHAMNLQLELLNRDAEMGAALQPRIEVVRHEMSRLDKAVNALLRFMRPEELNLSEVSLNDLVSEIGGQVPNERITVRYGLDQTNPMVTADRSLLGEAIRNVITNAVEAMAEGGTVNLATAGTREGWAELSISDNGPGIPDEHLDRIFQLYFTTKEDGSGLGLSLAARAIDLHHGTVNVQSKLGEGTTVVIRLPVADRPLYRQTSPTGNSRDNA